MKNHLTSMILTYKYSKDKKGDLKNAHHMMDSWY